MVNKENVSWAPQFQWDEEKLVQVQLEGHQDGQEPGPEVQGKKRD